MRPRTAFAVSLLVACGAFGSSEESNDGGAPLDAAPNDGAGPTDPDAGDANIALGPPTRAACDASRRCIDFEPLEQQYSPFGFDSLNVDVDGGLTVQAPGPASNWRFVARAIDNDSARGQIRFGVVPQAVRVRMKVRAESKDAGTASSSHFIMFTCKDVDPLSAKFTLGDDIAVQVGSQGSAFSNYVVGQWLSVDALWVYSGGTRKLTVTVDNGATKTGEVTSPQPCDNPLDIRIGSGLASGNGDFTIGFDDIGVDWN